MNLMHLYYFCKLAELQHYTRAAEEIHISQPSLSCAIASIEAELGIQLFQKKGRNICLTKYGKEFYGYVKNSLDILDEGVSVAKQYSGNTTGKIHIGTISTITNQFLPLIISDFQKRYPLVNIEYSLFQTASILSSLHSDSIDLGFGTFSPYESSLTFIPVLAQPYVAAIKKGHPLESKSILYLEDLEPYPLVSYSEKMNITREVVNMLTQSSLKANYSYCSESLLVGMIAHSGEEVASDSVAVMALVESVENPDVVFKPLFDAESNKPLNHYVHMIYKKDAHIPFPLSNLIELIQEKYACIVN